MPRRKTRTQQAQQAREAAACTLCCSIMESVADGILAIDLDHNITAFNPAAGALTRMSGEQAIGRKFFDALHPDVPEEDCPVCRAIAESESMVLIEDESISHVIHHRNDDRRKDRRHKQAKDECPGRFAEDRIEGDRQGHRHGVVSSLSALRQSAAKHRRQDCRLIPGNLSAPKRIPRCPASSRALGVPATAKVPTAVGLTSWARVGGGGDVFDNGLHGSLCRGALRLWRNWQTRQT